MARLYVGTSGYTYPAWRNIFYPEGVAQKDWLAFYAQQYNAVEINATFYRQFPPSVFARWHKITPPEFHFVLKAPKVITHEKALHGIDDELRTFETAAQALGEKLALVLWQFPASMRAEDYQDRVLQFLTMLSNTIRHVFEFRHTSWFTDELYSHLERFHAGFVINDSPRMATRFVMTGQVLYVRFHGPEKLYDSFYSREQLQNWADRIRPHLQERDAYLFFNNTMSGQALINAAEMRRLLAG
jgi:uncharacterized protein YecE (DUF72 family)